ncbi:uncharacterized protein LOC110259393 [Sus scrofa]|uniref:uncharacterized protein LOC110259393 n=1 Tax=Sus scrofa TaxID=9823 RepID=UPI000A2B77C2|nr:uncharacterized protein LOC110259393 [Sus scrofa]
MVFTASEVLGSAKIEGNSLYAEVKADTGTKELCGNVHPRRSWTKQVESLTPTYPLMARKLLRNTLGFHANAEAHGPAVTTTLSVALGEDRRVGASPRRRRQKSNLCAAPPHTRYLRCFQDPMEQKRPHPASAEKNLRVTWLEDRPPGPAVRRACSVCTAARLRLFLERDKGYSLPVFSLACDIHQEELGGHVAREPNTCSWGRK